MARTSGATTSVGTADGSGAAGAPGAPGRGVVVSALLAVAVLAAAGCAVVERANVATGGGQSAGEAWAPAISADGQVVAFVSAASDLVPGDTNGAADVFVHDFATGDTERVSVVDGGGETLYPTYTYALSPDGRYVAFEALLGELIPGTGPPVALRRWVGVHVRGTDRTSVAGSPSANLVEVAAPQFLDSGYLSTRQTDIGVGPAPFRTTEQGPCRPDSRVSGDSRWCVEIVGQPGTAPPGGPGLLVQAPGAGGVATILDAELTVDGSAPEAAPTGFALSRTGRFVAFASAAADHDAGDGNGLADVFVVDRDPDGDGTFDQQASLPVERISVPSGAGGDADGASSSPAISADGRVVVFVSEASNLVGGDTNGVADVFRYDRASGALERVSVGDGGAQPDGPSSAVVVDADATRAAFASAASNLVAADTNGVADVFRWTRAPSGAAGMPAVTTARP